MAQMTKNVKNEQKADVEEKKPAPVKYRIGNVVLNEWTNKNREGGYYNTYDVSKFFRKEGSDKWEYSKTFNIIELRRLHLLLGHRLAVLDTESVVVTNPGSEDEEGV